MLFPETFKGNLHNSQEGFFHSDLLTALLRLPYQPCVLLHTALPDVTRRDTPATQGIARPRGISGVCSAERVFSHSLSLSLHYSPAYNVVLKPGPDAAVYLPGSLWNHCLHNLHLSWSLHTDTCLEGWEEDLQN